MNMPLVLVIAMVVMFAAGIYLLLDRSLTRVLLGFMLAGNATNLLLFLMSGNFALAPILGGDADVETSDPLPQAFILTAIVITFGVTAFMLALIYRSWKQAREREDELQDDLEDIERAMSPDTLTLEEISDEDVAVTPEFSDGDDEDSVEPTVMSNHTTKRGVHT